MEATKKPKPTELPHELWLLNQKCWRKKGWWKSLKAARHRAKEIYKATGLQLYAYRCSSCKMCHLTKSRSAKGLVL